MKQIEPPDEKFRAAMTKLGVLAGRLAPLYAELAETVRALATHLDEGDYVLVQRARLQLDALSRRGEAGTTGFVMSFAMLEAIRPQYAEDARAEAFYRLTTEEIAELPVDEIRRRLDDHLVGCDVPGCSTARAYEDALARSTPH